VKRAIRSVLPDIDLSPHEVDGRDRDAILSQLATVRDGAPLDRSLLTSKQWNLVKMHGIVRSAGGARLWELGFWNLLQHYLSNEAVLLAHDGLGYESIVANWNSAEAIPWFLADFGTDQYLTITAGMAEIPRRLAAWFKYRRPGSVHLNHVLRELETIDDPDGYSIRLVFTEGDHEVQRQVRHVFLALPKGALERIDIRKLVDRNCRENFERLLRSATAHALFKLLLGYRKAWWNDPKALGADAGRVITDLPIRQVYYWEPDDQRNGVVMATYSDERYVEFWSPLIQRRGEFYCDHPEILDETEQKVLSLFGVTKAILDKGDRQLHEVHQEVAADLYPSVALVRDWSAPYFYGGWHTWNVRTHMARLLAM
jgi:hypothetical protein